MDDDIQAGAVMGVGDRVEVANGPYRGRIGTIKSAENGIFMVYLHGDIVRHPFTRDQLTKITVLR